MKLNTDNQEIAEELAKSVDKEQADFINNFYISLKYQCKTAMRLESQICDIAKHLNEDEGEKLIRELYEFIILKRR